MARRTPTTDEQRVELVPNFRPFLDKLPIPEAGICVEPCTVYRINNEWRRYFLAAMSTLDQPDIWDSEDPDEIFAARQQIRELIGMSPCSCFASGGGAAARNGIDELLGNDNQEIFDAGGLDALAPDRPDTSFSEDTGDTGDEIRQRKVALCWAANDYVASVAEKGILQGIDINPALTIATVALSFTFGPIIGLGFGVVTQGIIVAVSETLQDDSTVEAVACCLHENLLDQTITEANFAAALDTCPDLSGAGEVALGNLVQAGLDHQKNFLAFVKMLGAYMGAVDELSACACDDFLCTDFTIDEGGFAGDPNPGPGLGGVYDEGTGWDNGVGGTINHRIAIRHFFDEDIAFTSVTINTVNTLTGGIRYVARLFDEAGDEIGLGFVHDDDPPTQSHTFNFAEVTQVRELRLRAIRLGLELDFPGHIVSCCVVADPAPFAEQ